MHKLNPKEKTTKRVGIGIILNKEPDILSKDFISSGSKDKNMENLEKRMYFLVPYNISPIQQAIQAGHAGLIYAYMHGDSEEYIDFIENWRTWIILNGGTTNRRVDEEGIPLGSLNQIYSSIMDFNKSTSNEDNIIKISFFEEPDLNDALTAICLVVDERVFNREDYPDFIEWQLEQSRNGEQFEINSDDMKERYMKEIGVNEEIIFLKELLNTKRLA